MNKRLQMAVREIKVAVVIPIIADVEA